MWSFWKLYSNHTGTHRKSHIYGIYSSKFPSLLHNAFQEVLETHHGVTTIILDVMQHDMQLAGSDPIYLNWSSNCFLCGKKREFACNSEGIYLLSLYLQNCHIMNSLEAHAAHLRALRLCSYVERKVSLPPTLKWFAYCPCTSRTIILWIHNRLNSSLKSIQHLIKLINKLLQQRFNTKKNCTNFPLWSKWMKVLPPSSYTLLHNFS